MEKLILVNSLSPNCSDTKIHTVLPSTCPVCRTALKEDPLNSYSVQKPGEHMRQYSLFFCPHCEKCFFVSYSVNDCYSDYHATVTAIYPYPTNLTCFSDRITKLSQSFVEIYHQAEEAESCNLTEICGLGYRKALEFLIKDYAIHMSPNDAEAIKIKPLKACIDNYIDNNRIHTLATASAWLGNDETHYVRKHEDCNLNSLKTFINATVSFIDADLSCEEAERLILVK